MTGVFVIKGQQPGTGIVEQVVAAEDAQGAQARAEAEGLTNVTVRPYAAETAQKPAPPPVIARDGPRPVANTSWLARWLGK